MWTATSDYEKPPFPDRGPGLGAVHMGPRGLLRFLILQLLEEEPRSGYDLIKQISERTFGTWRPSSGAIYPTLMEMEDQGLLEEVEQKRRASERGRKAYRITESGKEYLKKWGGFRHEVLSKMAGFRQMWTSFWKLTPDELVDQVQEAIDTIEAHSGEITELPNERKKVLKKVLEDSCKRLESISQRLKV